MATIRRSGSGWQALIRKKKYQGKTSKTFSSKAAAKLWANAVESSLTGSLAVEFISEGEFITKKDSD